MNLVDFSVGGFPLLIVGLFELVAISWIYGEWFIMMELFYLKVYSFRKLYILFFFNKISKRSENDLIIFLTAFQIYNMI